MASGDLAYLKLSGSTDGKGIKVTGTNSGGAVLLHTAHATSIDEIDILAYNNHATDSILLTLEWGGTTDPDCLIRMTIPPRVGLIPVVSGLPLSNSLTVKAFAADADDIMCYGRVRRID